MAVPPEALEQFLAEMKFAEAAWQRRGLNPSPPALCAKLEAMFNEVASKLMAESRVNAPRHVLKGVLTSFLSTANRSDFDTEEAEFVCDEAARLSRIVNVDVSTSLNRWLYGPILGTVVNLTRGRPMV
jgi:hypothetical protein